MSEYCVVTTTVPKTGVANRLAREVVQAGLGACVQQFDIQSTYTWEGEVHEAAETMLLIKTKPEHFAALSELIAFEHPYEVPEIIQTPITAGNASYLSWINDATN